MGKTYLRYEEEDRFGIIVGNNANVLYIGEKSWVITQAIDEIKIWNIKLGTLVKKIKLGKRRKH